MSKHSYFAHKGKDGSTFSKRMTKRGYPQVSAAENIAMAPNANTVLVLWEESRGHKKNMLGKKYSRVGIARTGNYWTAIFAASDDT